MDKIFNAIASFLRLINVINEVPGYIWEDTVNGRTYICYPKTDRTIETDALWKVQFVDNSSADHYIIKRTSLVVYDVAICVGAINEANIETQLTALYTANSFTYHKTFN